MLFSLHGRKAGLYVHFTQIPARREFWCPLYCVFCYLHYSVKSFNGYQHYWFQGVSAHQFQHLPLLKAIQSAEGLHKSTVFLPVLDLWEVLSFLDMLASLTTAASCSVGITGNDSLPPYPALGLAWMMHALNRSYATLSEIQALHQLATLAASPATAKLLAATQVPKSLSSRPMGSSPVLLNAVTNLPPSGPRIAPHPNVLIKPCPKVLLLQAIIKDHPQKP